MYNNIFWFSNLNVIGGTETFLYYLAKKYKEWDITVLYKKGDPLQVGRISQYCRCIQWHGEHLKCKKLFIAFNHKEIIDAVEADEYCFIAHSDYKARHITPPTHPKITKYYGVSQAVCNSWKELTGIDMECLYLPLEFEPPKKVIKLVSATRLTPEKGLERMRKLVNALDSAGVNYTWTIFTNSTDSIASSNVVYRRPRLNVIDYIKDADYLVQLSDSEAYCYSVAESLSVGTPVIVTDIPALREIGVVDHQNGFILDMDMSSIPIDDICKCDLKFTYEAPQERWETVLEPGDSTYDRVAETAKVRVKPIKTYFDVWLNKKVFVGGSSFYVTPERAKYLIDRSCVKIV